MNRRRHLPDFLVIGAQRSGTSSLWRYLGAHPQIVPALRKEVGYFSRHYGRGLGWYRAHFPLGERFQTFEATPDYLLDPRAPQRAAALLPDARLIVLLRDPVERAWSQYQHTVRLGFEDLPFADALAVEKERLAEDLRRIGTDPHHDPHAFCRYSYATRGQYADQLERWLEYYPREQMLILRSESFYTDTAATFATILNFIGVTEWVPPSFPVYGPRGTSQLDPTVRCQLEEHFRPFNQRLEQYLLAPT